MTVLPGYRQGWDPLSERAWVTHGLHSYRRLMVEHPDPASDPMLPLVRTTQSPGYARKDQYLQTLMDVPVSYPWTHWKLGLIGWRTTIDDGQQPLRHGTLTLETIEISHEHNRRLPRQAPLCDQDVCADQPHLQTRQVFKGCLSKRFCLGFSLHKTVNT